MTTTRLILVGQSLPSIAAQLVLFLITIYGISFGNHFLPMPLLRRWLYKILGVWGKLGRKEMFLFISNYDKNSRWIANCLKHLLPRCRWLKWYKSLTSDCPDIFDFCLQQVHVSWWCHQMKTFSALLALCAENSQVSGEFPTQRPVA